MRKLYLLLLIFCTFSSFAQHADNPMPYFTFGKGIGITPSDSIYSVNIRFRMQNRVAMTTVSDKDLSTREFEMMVRRLRLRFDGFVYSPKFAYAIQFSFSRGDMDWDVTQYPNIVRDAMFFYKPDQHLTIGVGQTKLPGNRQRIISSGEQQFADRSIVNAIFNNDRDFGVQLYYDNHIGRVHYNLRGAISNGEGRNVARTNNGLMYSSRIEIQPLGRFTNGGDFFEGDLAREAKPKLSVAAHYATNQHTTRAGGTLGLPLYGDATYVNYGSDILFKYKGLAVSAEAIRRESPSPVTIAPDGISRRYIYTGSGFNGDVSYVFGNNMMTGARYSTVMPDNKARTYEHRNDQYAIVAGKFFRGHRLKTIADLSYTDITGGTAKNYWQIRFQIEIGI
jgi:phosphate-selective porin OprO/OprP